MSTVIFDFDSTLINCESLEIILAPLFAGNSSLQDKFKHLTELGMNGEISFKESFEKRLALAAPSWQGVLAFTKNLTEYLTPGIRNLIQVLQKQNVDIWILSGGLYDVIAPFAKFLNIPSKQVLAVSLNWHDDGSFAGIPNCDLCSQSKALAATKVANLWTKPSIMIGDGMTDYEVYSAGLSTHFIAYTEHVNRPYLRALNVPHANNTRILQETITRILLDN